MTWSVIRNQPPEGMSTPQLQAHQLFCDTVIDLLAFVGHTAGVERAGKAYPLIHTKLRKRLGADTLNMLVYIFHNMRLLYSEIQSDAPHFDDFGLGLLDEEQARVVDAELPALSTIPARIRDEPATRDGSQDDSSECESSECESSEGSDSSDSSDSGGADGGEATDSGAHPSGDMVPYGFSAIVQAPLKPLTPADVGRQIVAMVKLPRHKLGWHFGKLTRFFDAVATPRYAALYNFDVLFTGQRGPVGMKLETNGATTRYYTGTPEEGAWSFVTPDAS